MDLTVGCKIEFTEAVLHDNFMAEENNVSLKERKEIQEKLDKAYYEFYKLERKEKGQKQLLFE